MECSPEPQKARNLGGSITTWFIHSLPSVCQSHPLREQCPAGPSAAFHCASAHRCYACVPAAMAVSPPRDSPLVVSGQPRKGGSLAVLVQIHQDSLNGTVGQSVLLPVSYTVDAASRFPVSIHWTFHNSPDKIIACTVSSCSLGPRGAPRNCSASCFPKHTYRGRAEFFPENASLLLRHLKLSDSGVYSVTFRPSFQTRRISLAVHEQRFAPGRLDPSNTKKPEHVYYWAIGICSSVALLLLFLLFCCLRRRGAAQQKKRRITKQQVSSVEEPHMGSTAARDMATIYARIGDRFEEPQPRPPSEVVYTSITEPGPPALDTGLYHLLV